MLILHELTEAAPRLRLRSEGGLAAAIPHVIVLDLDVCQLSPYQ